MLLKRSAFKAKRSSDPPPKVYQRQAFINHFSEKKYLPQLTGRYLFFVSQKTANRNQLQTSLTASSKIVRPRSISLALTV
ncbi:MAG: hypothetical protein OET63_16075, partial [Desulfobacterales bacterium]|nr:hypothetical protein [Desulfobacterales bacterium]